MKLFTLILTMILVVGAAWCGSPAASDAATRVNDLGTWLFSDFSGSGASAVGSVHRHPAKPSNWNKPGFNDLAWPGATIITSPPGGWLSPVSSPEFSGTGALWIGVAANGHGTDFSEPSEPGVNGNKRGVYLYRKTFTLPATAFPTAAVGLASDNYGWLDLDGVQVLGPKNPGAGDKNYCATGATSGYCSEVPVGPGPSTATIQLTNLASCSHVLAAEVHNGTPIWSPNEYMGVVFSLTQTGPGRASVIWLDPIDHWVQPPGTPFTGLQMGSTLPIKFQLNWGGTQITEVKNIYVVVTGPVTGDPPNNGPVIESWVLGNGVDALRFSTNHYLASFQSKNYSLQDGKIYRVLIFDTCDPTIPLGYRDFVAAANASRPNTK